MGKGRHRGGDYTRRALNGEGTTWGKELHAEGTTQREETKWGEN